MRRGIPARMGSPAGLSMTRLAGQAGTASTAVADDEGTGTAGTPNACRSAVLWATHAFAPTGRRASGGVPEGSQHSCAAAGRSSICGNAARSITQAASATLAWAKPSAASSTTASRRRVRRVMACASYTDQRRVRLNLNAFMTTETELIAIAAPANMGERSKPKAG